MLCWARTVFIAVVVTLGLLSMVSACGQKGPLYLPDEAPAKTSQPGTDVPDTPAQPAAKTQSNSH
jgi:predicted small lipoprotein YifL